MKRAVTAAIVAAVAALAIVAIRGPGERYRVAAIFDTAKGTLAGQQVKIAGAVVGRVESVGLAPGPKARLVLALDRRFAPFHADASCRILPEGIISENFVACDPGSPSRPPLARVAGTPTVPVSQTSVPTSLQDVMNVFSVPTDDRIRVLLDELGIASAGRGADLNALLRRANPALAQSNRLLTLVNGQRDRLANAVTQTDRILSALASNDTGVERFVARTADVVSTTAARRGALAATVRGLPALLGSARPALRSLDLAVIRSTPLLHTLQASAPALSRVTEDIPPFASAASATLDRLVPVSDAGRTMVQASGSLVGHLRSAAQGSLPFSGQLDELLRNTRDRGGIEGVMRWFYGLAAATSAYDSTSHIAGALIRTLPQCMRSASAPGCTNKYDSPAHGTIPPDDPSCGPQNGAPWDPPTTCVAQQYPASGRHVSRKLALPVARPTLPHSGRPAPGSGGGAPGPGGPLHPPTLPLPRLPSPKVPGVTAPNVAPHVTVPNVAPHVTAPHAPAPAVTGTTGSRSLDDALLDYLLGP